MEQRSRRPGFGRPWPGAAVVSVACLLAACGGSGDGSPAGSPPPRASADPHTAPPSPSPSGSRTADPPASPSMTASVSPRCLAGAVTVTHGTEGPSVQNLCVRSGTTVTVVLEPRAHDSWPQPRSSNPMLALVTSSATDSRGVSRVTVRAARTGAATVTWGPRSAPLFTLRLSVAAYPVQ